MQMCAGSAANIFMRHVDQERNICIFLELKYQQQIHSQFKRKIEKLSTIRVQPR